MKFCRFVLTVIIVYSVAISVTYSFVFGESRWWHPIAYMYDMILLFIQLPYSGFLTGTLKLLCENIKINLSRVRRI